MKIRPTPRRRSRLPFVMGVMADLSGNTPGRRKGRNRGPQIPRLRHGQSRQRGWRPSSPASASASTTSSSENSGEKMWRQSALQQDGGLRAGGRRQAGAGSGEAARGANSIWRTCMRYMDGKVAAEEKLTQALGRSTTHAGVEEPRRKQRTAANNILKHLSIWRASSWRLKQSVPNRRMRRSQTREADEFLGAAEAELQAAHRARGDGSRECRQDPGRAGAGRYQPRSRRTSSTRSRR